MVQTDAEESVTFSRKQTISSFRDNSLYLALIASFLLIAFFVVFYGRMLPVGSLQHGDEYLTLDRSYSFVLRDDWFTVFSSNQPTFKKPPLQYWLSAELLGHGFDTELALRLPSFVFGIALLAIVGALAFLVLPSNPWVIPAAILLLGSSLRFWQMSLSGLLDSGAIFFATAALTATLAAMKDPRWFYAVAAATGIAALQKAPIPLAFSGMTLLTIALTRRWHSIDLRRVLLTRHFLLALVLTAIGVLFWPTLQWLRFGPASFDQAIVQQVAERFSPFGTGSAGPSWLTKMLAGEPLPRLVGFAAMIWLPWRLARMELLTFPVMVAAYGIIVALATGLVSPRYSLIFVPMMSVSLAAAVLILKWKPIYSVICLVGLSALSLGPVKSAASLRLLDDPIAKYLPILEEISRNITSRESFIVCGNRGTEGRVPAGAISYYASKGEPVHTIRNPQQLIQQAASGAVHAPYRGFCGEEIFALLRPLLVEPNIVSIQQGFVHWTSRDLYKGKRDIDEK